MLGELWIDQPDLIQARMQAVPETIRDNVAEFADKGFTIFRGLIPEEMVDQIIADTRRVASDPQEFVINAHGKHIDPAEMTAGIDVGHRILDLFAVSAAARDAIGHPTLVSFLRAIFGDDVIAMQSLYFEYGSQQAIHQDTAYVVSGKPLHLAASWIALEDVNPGAGELIYYPGSHRFDHFLFSDKHKHWNGERDGDEQHQAFLQSLHDKARESGLKKEAFLARKGDVLIWHADLAHGGGAITEPNATRKSLVTHYCPRSVKPLFRHKNHPHYVEVSNHAGLYFASAYYDLRKLLTGRVPVVAYDRGLVRGNPLKTIHQNPGARLARWMPSGLKSLLRKGLTKLNGR